MDSLESGAATHRSSLLSFLGFRAWLFGITGVTLIFVLQPFYSGAIGPISNILPAACATTAFASALACARRYGVRFRLDFGSVWFLFSLGTGLWSIAESTWAYYYFVLNTTIPYPSMADIFYVGGYLPIIAALVGYLRTFHVSPSRRRKAYAVLAIGTGVALALSFVLPIELSTGPSLSQFITDMTYPVLDLVLFTLTVLSLAVFAGGRIAKWWMLFGAGSVMYVIADEYFLYQVAHGSYYNGSLDDLIFLLGYLTFALAFYAHRKEF